MNCNLKRIRFDSTIVQCLIYMEFTTTGTHLQQFVFAIQWVYTAIPDFAYLISELHEIMYLVYEIAGKRTKRAESSINLTAVGWAEKRSRQFDQCKKELTHQCNLNYREPDKRLCLYTDASEVFWSGLITQVCHTPISLPHKQQEHQPLEFLSGKFNSTKNGWAIL